MTREEWLGKVATKVTELLFQPAGYDVPKNIRYTCGFPSKMATSLRNRRIGECWSVEASADKTFEIMISPVLGDGISAASVLVHEIVHAVVGLDQKHNRIFGKCARKIGLVGKLTSTSASDTLKSQLQTIIAEVGDYPHAELHAIGNSRAAKTDPAVKMQCPSCESSGNRYILRIGPQSLRQGAPLCPVHITPLEVC